MSDGDGNIERLVALVRQDAQTRAAELDRLNELLEQRIQVLEQKLSKGAMASRWFAALLALLLMTTGGWIYFIILEVSSSVGDMSSDIGQLQGYLKKHGTRPS